MKLFPLFEYIEAWNLASGSGEFHVILRVHFIVCLYDRLLLDVLSQPIFQHSDKSERFFVEQLRFFRNTVDLKVRTNKPFIAFMFSMVALSFLNFDRGKRKCLVLNIICRQRSRL